MRQLSAFVGHVGAIKIKRGKLGKSFQFPDAGIRNLGVVQV